MYTLDTTSQADLDNLMKDIRYFRGTHPKDWTMNKQVEREEYLILNTNTSEHDSGHWVAVCNKPSSKYIEYFDSFGLSPPEDIYQYMLSSRKQIMYITNELQEMESTACGYWCVMYLRERSKNKDPYDIVYEYSLDNQGWNEKKLQEYFCMNIFSDKMSLRGDGLVSSIAKKVLTKANFSKMLLYAVKNYFPDYYEEVRDVLTTYGMTGSGILDTIKAQLLNTLSKQQILDVINIGIDKFAKPEAVTPLKQIFKRALMSGSGYQDEEEEGGKEREEGKYSELIINAMAKDLLNQWIEDGDVDDKDFAWQAALRRVTSEYYLN